MNRAVLFDSTGSIDNLVVREVPVPEPGPGEVRVRVHAAGLNPVDWKIIEIPAAWQSYGAMISFALPAGNGNDFAGTIEAIGAGVTDWFIGDEVFGGHRFFAQADTLVIPAAKLNHLPTGLSWEQAGSLDIAGRTAVASIRAVTPRAGETVLVSAAAGGVGVLAAQLARRTGARVIGTASKENHEFLKGLGVTAVTYGDDLVAQVRAVAPEGISAVLDNNGRPTLEAAVEFGVDPSRINTIAERAYAAEIGAQTAGAILAVESDFIELADLIATGEIQLPIDSSYPLEEVLAAYARLRAGHLRGKIVLTTGA